MNDDVVLLTCGPAEHGIVRFGAQLHQAAVAEGFTGSALHEADPWQLVRIADHLPPQTRLVHLQANDWLFSGAEQTAAQRITDFTGALRGRNARLTLTLHDLPHRRVSRELFLRRARGYLAMAAQAAGVVVSSDHERLLITEAAQALSDVGDGNPPTAPSRVTVIPLPVPASGGGPAGARTSHTYPCSTVTVGVLGFLYPGKGHHEIVEELAHFPTPLTIKAIGAPSQGHEALLPELTERSRLLGLAFVCTGFVPDVDLPGHLQAVTVPVAAAPSVSASASINTWIAAGRRPLVLAGRYTRELERRMPGSVVLYEPGELRSKVEQALAAPSSTRLPAGFRPEPTAGEVARRHLDWWAAVAAGSLG